MLYVSQIDCRRNAKNTNLRLDGHCGDFPLDKVRRVLNLWCGPRRCTVDLEGGLPTPALSATPTSPSRVRSEPSKSSTMHNKIPPIFLRVPPPIIKQTCNTQQYSETLPRSASIAPFFPPVFPYSCSTWGGCENKMLVRKLLP